MSPFSYLIPIYPGNQWVRPGCLRRRSAHASLPMSPYTFFFFFINVNVLYDEHGIVNDFLCDRLEQPLSSGVTVSKQQKLSLVFYTLAPSTRHGTLGSLSLFGAGGSLAVSPRTPVLISWELRDFHLESSFSPCCAEFSLRCLE